MKTLSRESSWGSQTIFNENILIKNECLIGSERLVDKLQVRREPAAAAASVGEGSSSPLVIR